MRTPTKESGERVAFNGCQRLSAAAAAVRSPQKLPAPEQELIDGSECGGVIDSLDAFFPSIQRMFENDTELNEALPSTESVLNEASPSAESTPSKATSVSRFDLAETIVGSILDGKDTLNSVTGLPNSLVFRRVTGKTSDVYSFFRVLIRPIGRVVPPRKRKLMEMTDYLPQYEVKNYLCMECVAVLAETVEHAQADSWLSCLCQVTHASNARVHLRTKHHHVTAVAKCLDKGEQSNNAVGALHSGMSKFPVLVIMDATMQKLTLAFASSLFCDRKRQT